jgi:plasmid stabilization system protein ParE
MAAIEGWASGSNVAQRTSVREGYWKFRTGMRVIYFCCPDDHLDVIRILHGSMGVDLHLHD